MEYSMDTAKVAAAKPGSDQL